MSKRHVSVLAVALVLVLVAIFLLLPGETAREPSDANQAALPGLEAASNELTRVVVTGAGDRTVATLLRSDDGWTVEELGGYGADLSVLRAVLGGLAEARVLEPKTDNPEYYARLGVEDVSAADANGLRVDLEAGDAQRWSVIVGNEAPQRGGYYLRPADQAGSLLADFDARVPGEATGWVEARVIDLMSGELAEVQLVQADGETLTARKLTADETDFSFVELPEGRELRSAWSINSLGSALSTLDFEAVAAADSLDWSDAISVRALRFDGLEVSADLVRRFEAGDWLRLSARAPAPVTGNVTADAGDVASTPVNGVAAVAEEAASINERVNGWAYRVPTAKADAMDQRTEDLLRPEGEESADAN